MMALSLSQSAMNDVPCRCNTSQKEGKGPRQKEDEMTIADGESIAEGVTTAWWEG